MAWPAPCKALKAVRYARQLVNWLEVGRCMWHHQPITHLQFRNGLVIYGNPATGLMRLYKEIWRHDVYRIRRDPLPLGATVIDVGANIGMFALHPGVASRAERVLCYEPFPESYALLQRNIEANRCHSVHAQSMGIAGSCGTRRLYVNAFYGRNHLFGAEGQSSLPIECITLADLFEREQVERCGFLKMDCEGAEFEILLTTPAAVLARIDRIALEYHDHLTVHRHDELITLFRAAGLATEVLPLGRRTGYLFASRLGLH